VLGGGTDVRVDTEGVKGSNGAKITDDVFNEKFTPQQKCTFHKSNAWKIDLLVRNKLLLRPILIKP
jgi:hypothetical protein